MTRRHTIGFVGYGLGQAHRRGICAEAAAAEWLEQLLAGIPEAGHTATADEVGAWVRRNAAAMEMHHGNARLESRGDAWRMTVDLREDRASLEGWGAPLEYFAGWVAAQTERIAQRHLFHAEVWLEGETLYLEFAPIQKP